MCTHLEPFAGNRIRSSVEWVKQLIINFMSLFDQGHKMVVVLPVVQLLIAVHDVGQRCKVVLIALQRPGEEPCTDNRTEHLGVVRMPPLASVPMQMQLAQTCCSLEVAQVHPRATDVQKGFVLDCAQMHPNNSSKRPQLRAFLFVGYKTGRTRV